MKRYVRSDSYSNSTDKQKLKDVLSLHDYDRFYTDPIVEKYSESIMERVTEMLDDQGYYLEPSIQAGQGEDVLYEITDEDDYEEVGSWDYESEMWQVIQCLVGNNMNIEKTADDMIDWIFDQ